MKELKDNYQVVRGPSLTIWWNPVKELKASILLRSYLICSWWNPVKELKVAWFRLLVIARDDRLEVESGEGIESRALS